MAPTLLEVLFVCVHNARRCRGESFEHVISPGKVRAGVGVGWCAEVSTSEAAARAAW